MFEAPRRQAEQPTRKKAPRPPGPRAQGPQGPWTSGPRLRCMVYRVPEKPHLKRNDMRAWQARVLHAQLGACEMEVLECAAARVCLYEGMRV